MNTQAMAQTKGKNNTPNTNHDSVNPATRRDISSGVR